MHLKDKLAAIPKGEIVAQVGELVKHARVGLNWYGGRIVRVDGYEGAVHINELASTYLKAKAFKSESNATLQERLDCYDLWDRVKELYSQSDKELGKSRLFNFLTPAREFRPYCRACAGDPMAIIREHDAGAGKESTLYFTPEEFKKIWPKQEPQEKCWTMGEGVASERWGATKEMVESANAVKTSQ
jgi:hypothetical protein